MGALQDWLCLCTISVCITVIGGLAIDDTSHVRSLDPSAAGAKALVADGTRSSGLQAASTKHHQSQSPANQEGYMQRTTIKHPGLKEGNPTERLMHRAGDMVTTELGEATGHSSMPERVRRVGEASNLLPGFAGGGGAGNHECPDKSCKNGGTLQNCKCNCVNGWGGIKCGKCRIKPSGGGRRLLTTSKWDDDEDESEDEEEKAKHEAMKQARERRGEEIRTKLSTMSVMDLLGMIFGAQQERVASYKLFEE